jgi:hypothetical protein
MVIETAAGEKFEIGRVLRRTFQVIGHNFLPFSMLAALVNVPEFAIRWLSTGINSGLPTSIHLTHAALGAPYYAIVAIEFLIAATMPLILQAAFIQSIVADLSGGRASLVDCLAAVANSFLSLCAIAAIAALPAVALELTKSFGETGLFIVIAVPLAVVTVCWSVVVPTFTVEHRTILASFDRSWDLTRGFRWPIFGLFVLTNIGAAILNLAASPSRALVLGMTVSSRMPTIALLVISTVIGIAIAMFRAALSGTIYYELRSIKEGVGTAAKISVFE